MDELYRKMNDDLEIVRDPHETSQIHKFYNGKTIFFTGCTGFIGKCVLEKLLRTCPEVKKIYVLIRQKGDQTMEERLNEYFQNVVFDALRGKNPEFKNKVVPLSGNLIDPGLGLSPTDRRKIIEETDIMIHNGASVLFDLRISLSLKINVLGTKEMLDLATECKHLQIFVYVSTAYSHCYKQDIKEEFYDSPADLKMVQDIITADTENAAGMTKDAVKMILGEWPNIYTFSKAVAEGVVQQYSRHVSFPCCIFRPSIVTSTWQEPIRSWCGNFNGPQAFLIGVGLGLVHSVHCAGTPIDFIPADMTANALLAVTWDATEYRRDVQGARIYNYGSSTIIPKSLIEVLNFIRPSMDEYPSVKAVWCPFLIPAKWSTLFWIFHLFVHAIPSLVVDILMVLLRMKPRYFSITIKVTRHLDKASYFVNGNWRIDVAEMTKIWEKMNEHDNLLFFNDLRKWDLTDYYSTYWIGIRKYLVNESLDTLNAARRWHKTFQVANYIIWPLAVCLILHWGIQLVNYILLQYSL